MRRAGRLTPFHELAGEADDSVVEGAVGADRVVEGARDGRVEEPVVGADPVVVLAEGRRDVDEAGAVLGGDEVPGDHREAAAARGRARSKTGPS